MLRSISISFRTGKEYCRTFSSRRESIQTIGILGVPLCEGQRKRGVELGPKEIRSAGLHKALASISDNIKIKDYGDITYTRDKAINAINMKNYEDVLGCNRALFHKVQDIFKENSQVLTLGGDHAIAMGSVLGHLNHDPDLVLIWVDAHADINLNVTSPSGNIHGMPVSFMIEELKNCSTKFPKIDWITKRIQARKIAYIGLRDIDPFESTILKKLGISAFGMNYIDKYGLPAILEMISNTIDPSEKSNIHISFDIDSLDPFEAPSTGTRVRGGLTLREGIQIMEHFAKTERVTGVDLVEVNPQIGSIDDVKKTTDAAIQVIKAAFGHNRSGNPRTNEELEQKLL